MQIRTLLVACAATLAAGAAALVSGAHFTSGPGRTAPDLGWLPPLAPQDPALRIVRVSPFGQGPARFEPNLGQAPSHVRWIRRGPSEAVFLGDDGFTTVVHGRFAMPFDVREADVPHGVAMRFAGAAAVGVCAPEEPLACVTNYFRGADPSQWVRNVPNYARVRYDGVWPGIDVVFHGRDGRLEYDFLVAPGADTGAIALDVEGADSVHVDSRGDLVLGAGAAEIRHRRPLVWQETGEGRRRVACAFVVEDGTRVRFRLTGRDPSLPAVIDPLVVITRRYGASLDDAPVCVATTTANGVVLGGITESADFVGTGQLAGDFDGLSDGFVMKIDAGSATVTATAIDIIGSDGQDGVTDLRVARNGEITAALFTSDAATFLRVGGPTIPNLGGIDAGIVRLTPDAQEPIVSYPFGGPASDIITGLALDDPGPSTVTPTAQYAGMLSTSTSLPGFASLPSGRNALVFRMTPDGTQTAQVLAGSPGTSSFAPVRLEMAQDDGHLFLSTAGERNGFTTTPGAYTVTTTASFPGFVAKYAKNLATRPAATFFSGSFTAMIMSLAIVPGGDIAVAGDMPAGSFASTPNSAFPNQTNGERAFLGVMDSNLALARTISNIGGGGATFANTILGVTSTAHGSEVIVVGQSNVLTATEGGVAFHGNPGSSPPDAFIVIAGTGGNAARVVTHDGSPASETMNIGALAGLGIEFGHFAALRSDGGLVLAYQTDATAIDFPELVGPFGGMTDVALRSVTPTALGFQDAPPPERIDLDVTKGIITVPGKLPGRGKVNVVCKLTDDDGVVDFGLRGTGRLDLRIAAPMNTTFTADLVDLSVAMNKGKLTYGGRVQTIVGKDPDGTRFNIVVDTRKRQITFDLTNVPGMFKPYGTPILKVPAYVEVGLNNQISGQLVRATPLPGNRHKLVDFPQDVLWSFSVTPATVRFGHPNTLRANFENPTNQLRILPIWFRHKGFDIFNKNVVLGPRQPLTWLPTLGSATYTVATPGTGLQTWNLLVDGDVVSTKKTTTTK